MKFIRPLICTLFFLFITNHFYGQCVVDLNLNGIYKFNDPDGPGGYGGFLCDDFDSLHTTGITGYYDGDGYSINLIAGTSVNFRIDSCTGDPCSLTILDSTNTIIPGAFSPASCPNSLNFIATYTGKYIIGLNKNGACAGGGSNVIGQTYVCINASSGSVPCASESFFINDTICGAISLFIDSVAEAGNNTTASITDPMDQTAINLGFGCSTPNNTLWYTFKSATADTLLNIVVTADTGSAFVNWVVVFIAGDPQNPCVPSALSYGGCAQGADDVNHLNRVVIPFTGVSRGNVYYIMIDGASGATGGFTVAIESPLTTSVKENDHRKSFSVYPNPATNNIYVKNNGIKGNATIKLTNIFGKTFFSKRANDFSEEVLDVSSLASGIYILQVESGAGLMTKRVVVTGN